MNVTASSRFLLLRSARPTARLTSRSSSSSRSLLLCGRCAAYSSLPLQQQKQNTPLDRRWRGVVGQQQRRGAASAAAAMLEEAQEPETLSQETIIDNMSSDEWKRLSRVRNIGIAVGSILFCCCSAF